MCASCSQDLLLLLWFCVACRYCKRSMLWASRSASHWQLLAALSVSKQQLVGLHIFSSIVCWMVSHRDREYAPVLCCGMFALLSCIMHSPAITTLSLI
jgi:hypothetical protein